MKLIKLFSVMLTAVALMTLPAMADSSCGKKEGAACPAKKESCPLKKEGAACPADKGKKCENHKCCVEAKKAGKACEKCAAKKAKKDAKKEDKKAE